MYLHTFCKSHLLPREKRSDWVDTYSFDNNCIYTSRFPPKFLPHFTICLDMSKILKYADQLLHKQAKLISTSKLTRIRTIILWPVIYNNRFFSKMNGSFDPLHVRWIFLQRFERTEMMLAHGTRQGYSSASRTHKC